MKRMLLVLILLLAFVGAHEGHVHETPEETPHTVEVITARGSAVFPVSFFNDGSAGTYSAKLIRNSPAVRLDTNNINVANEEFGSFNLLIGNDAIARGVYFDNLIISKGEEIIQEIPIIVGLESKISEIEYDVSIDFDAGSDISDISGDTVLSPIVNVYKLNYNDPISDSVALNFAVYSMQGELITMSEETVSVSRQSSFEHFFNLGATDETEVLMVVSARKEGSFGLDLSQVSLGSSLLFSPTEEESSPKIYLGIFAFLIAAIVIISYFWYNRSVSVANDWQSELNRIKKTKFGSNAKKLRRLSAQRDVLERAYSSKYISRASYHNAINEIDKVSAALKKRL